MPSIYKCVAVQQNPFVIKHEIRIAPVYKEEAARKEEPEFDEEALRQIIRQQVVDEIQAEKTALLENAKQEVESYLVEAKKQAETIKQQAFEEGKEAGKEAGYQVGVEQGKNDIRLEMQQELNSIANSANAIVNSAHKEAQNMIVQAERQIIDIALAVARKVVAREIEENPAMVLPLVKTALEKVRDQEQIVVRVSLDDFELVNEAKSDLQIMAGCEQTLSVMADPTITAGSCVIDTAYGSVDSRIDRQFAAIQKILQEVMP